MDNPTLFITCNASNKSVIIEGMVAVREQVIDVYVRNGADLIDSGLVLKIQTNGNKGNTAPIGQVSEWDVSGLDAKGVMNLNTTEAIKAFVKVSNTDDKTFNILVFTTETSKLECNGLIRIMNFPSSATEDPVTLDQAATIAGLETSLSERVAYVDFAGIDDLNEFSSSRQIIAALNNLKNILKGTG